MDSIIHPVTKEKGFFCTKLEKQYIDAIFSDYFALNSITTSSSDGSVNDG